MAGRALGAVILALQTGAFALFAGKPQVVSQVQLVGHNELQIVQRARTGGKIITRYVLNEGRPLHLVLVRDDFRSFSHVHPAMQPNGAFRARVALDAGHRFYAYVASQPAGMSRQVFRFVLQAGAPPHHLATTIAAPRTTSVAGPYTVRLDRAVLTQTPATLRIYAKDRAMLHTVLVDTETLTYAHVDAALQSGTCCTYALPLPRLAPGLYRMWAQFVSGGRSGGRRVQTAAFTLAVR
jgi:hypothetical protein